MNRILLLAGFVCAGLYGTVRAQEARTITISGRISTDQDSAELVVWFARDLVIGYGQESKKIVVPVAKDGKFSFTIPAIDHLARLSLHDRFTGAQLFSSEQQIIAPGDRVELFGNICSGSDRYFKAVFFGKGAAKYECVQALKAIDIGVLDKARGMQNVLSVYDSLLNIKQKIINNFQYRLSATEYELIRTDMTGELRNTALTNITGYRFGSFHNLKTDTVDLASKKEMFDGLMQHFSGTAIDEQAAAGSMMYRSYLYTKTRAGLLFGNNGNLVSIKQLFQALRDQYSGLLRDKLLGQLFLNSTENYYFFGGIDPEEYRQCLQQAYAIMQTQELKNRMKQQLDGLVKGAPAFNFTLPVDSSAEKRISLSDLKGKVVLMDLWGYPCGGCMLFTQVFHKKIYPAFSHNPNFVVASIMLNETGKPNYLRALHNEGTAAYSYGDYLNLFGGKGVASARQMENFYHIDAFPTILLIDKQGRIYSSTLPVIYGDPRNKELEKNIGKFTDLINKALSEPDL